MAEGIYRSTVGALVDGDRLAVSGRHAGPAGVSGVELPDGSVWEVDHADPSVPVLLEVDAMDASTSPLLVTAFGGDGAMFLADDAIRMTGGDPGGNTTVGNQPAPHPYLSRRRPFANEPAQEAGQAVLLADLGNDRRAHPLARATACLEFAVFFDSTDAGPVLKALLADLLGVADRFANEVDDDELASLHRWTVDGLRNACLRAREVGPGLDGTLSELLRRIDRVTFDEPELVVSALRLEGSGPDLSADAFTIAASVAATPPRPKEPEPTEVWRTEDAVVRVTVTRSDTERWVRVLHRGGLVLLGQAPLRREGLLDSAEVVVPADVDDDDLEIQVLAPGELTALVDRPVDAIRRAVNAGREAARSERLGDREVAEHRWERCAALWIAAGEDQRAEQARDLASSGTPGPRLRSVADSIAEALGPNS